MTIFIMLICWFNAAEALEPPAVTPAISVKVRNKKDAALIIGNESYQKFPQVIYAVNDAKAFQQTFKNTFGIYRKQVTYIENAKKKKILKGITKMGKKARKKGTLWIYFAGHGYTKKDGSRAILPTDAKDMSLETDAITLNEIITTARKKTKFKRLVIIADAGFGNIGRDGLDVYGSRKMSKPNPLPYNDPDTIVWIPNKGDSAAPTFPIARQGLFSYGVLGAIRGWADGEVDGKKDGNLSMGEAQAYVAHKVVQLGLPIKPSKTPLEASQNWTIRSGNLEKGPDDKLIRALSADLRSRRVEELAQYKREEAKIRWQSTLYDAKKGGKDGEEALQMFLDDYEFASISMEWTIYVPEVAEAKRLMQNYQNLGNIVAFNPEECQDIKKLEPLASKGALNNSQIACLESRIRLNRIQTERASLSKVLIINSQAKKDMSAWENYMDTHLEHYDRSDPGMTMMFAIHMYNKGGAHNKDALKWANYALENRQQWEGGADYVDRCYNLYKLRANISTKIWMAAETQYRKVKSPEAEENATASRGLAKTCAREWLDYARASGKKTKAAFNMCVSAAGAEFCKE